MAIVEQVIRGTPKDLGGFAVRRVLPTVARRTIGPFVFVDHIGPAVLPPGPGVDVRPHPHIGLATLTWLFDGEIVHRDSVGSHVRIQPGAVNWMVAGRGVVHSERTSAERAETGGRIEGLQVWIALPVEDEACEPSFEHHPAGALPTVSPQPGVSAVVVAGTAWGARSPVGVRSPTLYVDAALDDGARLPLPSEHAERAIYVIQGQIELDGVVGTPGDLLVVAAGAVGAVVAQGDARIILIGGAPLPERRFLWWNFVSSAPERIEQAAALWRAGGFPVVPGDEHEHIPAPDGPLPFVR